MQKHFSAGSFTVPRLVDLLQRYAPENLQPYWSIPFAIFGIGAIIYLVKGRDIRIKSLILGAFSFFFFITIAVKSLNPIIPAEDFINRYFSVVLVPVFLALAFMAEGVARRGLKTGRAKELVNSPRIYIAFIIAGFLATLIIFSMPFFPDQLRQYAHSPFDLGQHPFVLNERYRQMANAAYADGIPIVASQGGAGGNAVQTCAAYFLDLHTFKDGRTPELESIFYDGKSYVALFAFGEIESQTNVILARRSPFRLNPMLARDLPELIVEKSADQEK
jgi:hypothetical protein